MTKTNILKLTLLAIIPALLAGVYVYLYISNDYMEMQIGELTNDKAVLEMLIEELEAEQASLISPLPK